MISIPCALIFSTPILVTYNEVSKGSSPWWMVILALITGFALSWVYWGYSVTQWRLLAYRKSKNIKALKKKAINEFLIWPDNHWLIHAEFRTEKQRKQLRSADRLLFIHENNMTLLNADNSDVNIEEINVQFNKALNFFEVLFCVIAIVIGFMFLFLNNFYLGFIFLFFGVMGSIYEFRQFKDRKNILSINIKGIETQSTGCISWKNIIEATTQTITRGKRSNDYLQLKYYPTHRGKEQKDVAEDYIELTEYNVTKQQVNAVLHNYSDKRK